MLFVMSQLTGLYICTRGATSTAYPLRFIPAPKGFNTAAGGSIALRAIRFPAEPLTGFLLSYRSDDCPYDNTRNLEVRLRVDLDGFVCRVGTQRLQENSVVVGFSETFQGDVLSDARNDDASVASFPSSSHGHDVSGLQPEFVHAITPYLQEIVRFGAEVLGDGVKVVEALRLGMVPGCLGAACGDFREVFLIKDRRAFSQELNAAFDGGKEAYPAFFREGVEEVVDAPLILDAECFCEFGAGWGQASLSDVMANGIERLALPVGESDSLHDLAFA